MQITGLGTRDSPIALLDESEDEVVTSVLNLHHDSYSPLDDLLFSPRPGTFLSGIHRVPLAQEWIQEGAQPSRKRKRQKAVAPRQNPPVISVQSGETNPPEQFVTEVNHVQVQQESKKQRKLRMKLERERMAAQLEQIKENNKQEPPHVNRYPTGPIRHTQNHEAPLGGDEPPTKRVKQSKASVDRTPLTPTPVPGPSSSGLVPMSQEDHAQHRHTLLSPDHSLQLTSAKNSQNQRPPVPQHTGGFVTPLLSRPVDLQNHFNPYFNAPSMVPNFSGYGMQFDPLFPWYYMPIGDVTPTTSLHPMPKELISLRGSSMNQTTNQTAPQHNPVPQKPPAQKVKPTAKQKAPKVQFNRQSQPTQSLHNPEKAFTIRILDRTMDHPLRACVPIGKPDFSFKHGVFPIIPSIMLPEDFVPSPLSPVSKRNPYAPNIRSTLVLENVPSYMCNMAWVEGWAVRACGVKPKHILLSPRRALVEFRHHNAALDAWVSPKLGVDDLGHPLPDDVGGGAHGVMAYWYRPDFEQEKGQVELWRHSKKILAELVSVAVVKDEGKISKALEEVLVMMCRKSEPGEREEGELEESEYEDDDDAVAAEVLGIEKSSLPLMMPSADDTRGDFRKFAEKLGFFEKLKNVVAKENVGVVSSWEQEEIARVDRVRSIMYAKLQKQQKQRSASSRRKRKLDDDEVGDLNSRDERVKKLARLANTKDVSTPRPTASTSGTSAAAPKSLTKPALQSSRHTQITYPTQPLSTVKSPVSTSSALSSAKLPSKLIAAPPPSTSRKSKPTQKSSDPGSIMLSSRAASPSSLHPKPMVSTTSSIIKSPRGFGLSLAIPSTTFSAKGNSSSPPSTTTLSTSLSVPVLRTTKKSAQTDSILTSVPLVNPASSPSTRAPPLLHPSTLPTVQRKDVVALPADSGRNSGPSILRPSELLVAVNKNEKFVITKVGDAGQPPLFVPVGGKARSPIPPNNVFTPVSTRKIGMGESVEGLVVAGRESLNRDLSFLPSPASTPDDTPTEMVIKPVPASLAQYILEPSDQPIGAVERNSQRKGDTNGSVDMDISPVTEGMQDPETRVSLDVPSSSISPQPHQQVTTSTSMPTTFSRPTLVPKPALARGPSRVKDLNVSLKSSAELLKILMQSTGNRQKFLDRELKISKALVDQLGNTTCRIEKKEITSSWKEKIRIMDEVTMSLRNDGKAWYSHLAMSWVQLRWPETPVDTGILVLNDDDEDQAAVGSS